MNSNQINKELAKLDLSDKKLVLLKYGHRLTIMAREAYEYQGDGVTKPRLLRDTNEILHRVFQALTELEKESEAKFTLNGIAHWISCEERDKDVQEASIQAFKSALET